MSSVLAAPTTTVSLLILCGIMKFISVRVDYGQVMEPMFVEIPHALHCNGFIVLYDGPDGHQNLLQ